MNIRPIKDRLLILLAPSPEERTTAAGLFAAAALPPPTTYGRVIRKGDRCRDVAVGDLVAFPPTVGDDITIGDYACLFVRESEIAAIIPKRNLPVEMESVNA